MTDTLHEGDDDLEYTSFTNLRMLSLGENPKLKMVTVNLSALKVGQ